LGEAANIRSLFKTPDLDEIVWQERIEDVAPPGAASVDVVIKSFRAGITETTRRIGLAWWPNGPVIKGVQNYTQGDTVTFPRVLVKPGGVLALASDSSLWSGHLSPHVIVVPSGEGAAVEAANKPTDPLAEGAKSFGQVIGLGLVGFVLWHVFLHEVRR
jgi:hypothetical protein